MKFYIYKDDAGEYRWRLEKSNGQNLADSSEGYDSLEFCLSMIDLIKKGVAEAEIN